MSVLPPGYSTGFGKAVRMASAHRFRSVTTREQGGDPVYVAANRRWRRLSMIGHGIAVLAFAVLSGWAGQTIGTAIAAPLGTAAQVLALGGAILLVFMGAFGFMRLAQAGVRALFDTDDLIEWPRKGVDWGQQTVVLDRDGIAVALQFARRAYPWDTMAELREDDVFVIARKEGAEIVIPKDPEDEDEMRERLFRGISLSNPVA